MGSFVIPSGESLFSFPQTMVLHMVGKILYILSCRFLYRVGVSRFLFNSFPLSSQYGACP